MLEGEDRTTRFLECLRLRPTPGEFAQRYTTSLFLLGDIRTSTMIDLLSLCNRVTCLNLALYATEFTTNASLWRTLDALPLKSLGWFTDADFISSVGALGVFKNMTHLDIPDELVRPNAAIEGLSALTHLCVALTPRRTDPTAVVRLIGNARLRLLACRVKVSHRSVDAFLAKHRIIDRRIVLLPNDLVLWSPLGQGDMLVWKLAEDEVKLGISESSESFNSSISISSRRESHSKSSLPVNNAHPKCIRRL